MYLCCAIILCILGGLLTVAGLGDKDLGPLAAAGDDAARLSDTTWAVLLAAALLTYGLHRVRRELAAIRKILEEPPPDKAPAPGPPANRATRPQEQPTATGQGSRPASRGLNPLDNPPRQT